MSKIKVSHIDSLVNGKQISFIAPCSSSNTDCLVIEDVEYAIVDAENVSVAGLSNVWNSGAIVSVILNVDTHTAFIQNPNTNPYLEAHLKSKNNPHGVTAEHIQGTLGGKVVANASSVGSYTTKQVRNIVMSTSTDGVTLANGDVLHVYK